MTRFPTSFVVAIVVLSLVVPHVALGVAAGSGGGAHTDGTVTDANANTTQSRPTGPNVTTTLAALRGGNTTQTAHANATRTPRPQAAIGQPIPMAAWPGQTGGPPEWVPLTDQNGYTIRNYITGQNLNWLRMSSGEGATGARGSLPTVQVASDGSNLFYRLRTLGSPYQFATNQWQNQGYYQMAIATQSGGQWTVQAYVGMHINDRGRVFIAKPGGTMTTVYAGNQDLSQAQGVRVTRATNGNDGAYWTDVQVPISAIQSATGISADTPIRLFFGTATQPNSINFDTMGNVGSVTFNSVNTVTMGDLTGPLVQNVRLSTPSEGATVTTGTPTITGTTTAGGGTLRVYVDGVLVGTIENVGESWSYTLTSAQALTDGTHTVRAELTRSGNLATTTTRTFTVDTVPPPTITTTSVHDWTLGQAGYSQSLAATGGTGPYTWSIASGALPAGLALSTSGTISGTPTQQGTYTFTARVTDSKGRTSTKTFTLTVNAAPTMTSTSPLPGGVQGVTYTRTLAVAGGTQPYAWSVVSGSLPAGLSLASDGTISGTPTTAGAYTFTARVTDAAGATTTRTFTLTVGDGLSLTSTSVPAATAGQSYSATLAAAGGTQPYAWSVASGTLPPGLSLTSDGTLSGTPTTAGTYTFTARVTDADGTQVTRQFTLQVNQPLSVGSPDTLPATPAGVTYTQTLLASGGTQPYTWSVASGSLPPGLTLTADGTLSGAPTQPGTYTFTAAVTDTTGATATKQYALTVTPALAVSTTGLPQWTVGQAGYTGTLAAAGGTQPYTWSATGLPTGLTLDPATGTITGTPTQTGTFPVSVTVRDADGTTATAQYTLVITDTPTVATTSPLRTGVAGVSYTDTLAATGGTAPTTWRVTAGSLPAGLTLAADGTISGTPTTAGTYQFTATVTDAAGATATRQFQLTVRDGLTVAAASLPDWTTGQPYTGRLEAAGGTQPYTWNATGLPDGLTLNASTGVVSGTPTQPGTFDVTVSVTDADGTTVTTSTSVTIAGAPSITTASLRDATERVAYSQSLTATGGTAPYAWTVTNGSLPDGLTLASDGTLSGTPTQQGTSTVTVTATDAAGATVSQQYTLTVRDGLAVSTTSLPQWTVGQNTTTTLAASGGTQPYTWTVSAGNLPAGLSLASDGTISGTPTQPGTYTVALTVRDADGTTVTETYTLTVNERPRLTAPSTLPLGVQNVSYSAPLTATGGTGALAWHIAAGSLPDGLTLDTATGTISGTPTQPGSATFTVTATDATGATVSQQYTLTVGDGLTLTTGTLDAWTVGQAGYSTVLTAAGGTSPYTWSVASGSLPPGVTLDESTGELSGTPTQAGSYTFAVTVTDADGSTVTRQFALTVNERPQVTAATTLPNATERVAYTQPLDASGGTAPLSWTVASGSLPPGLTLTADGTISGTPTSAGTYTVTVTATDATGATATKTLTLTVDAGLTLTTPTLPAWTVGHTSYNTTLTASGGTPAYAWSAAGLPEGLTLDPVTGTITGTPVQQGAYTVSVTVTDADGTQVTRQFALTVNAAPTLTTPSTLPSGVQNVSYSAPLTATGGTSALSWRVSAGSLPDGLSLNTSTGTISGTPTQPGTSTFTVTVTDATGATATQQYTIDVGTGLTVTTSTLGTWTAGQAGYADLLAAAGGTAPYSWNATGLPSGVTLDPATGVISGTPTTPGTYTVEATVTDADGTTVTETYTLTVADPPAITTTSLPNATERVAYSQPIALTGGTEPVTWRVSNGSLPPGLSLTDDGRLTGIVAGTPTVAGSYTFTVTATDAAGATASQQYTIDVSAGLAVETTVLPAWTAGQPYTATLTAAGGTAPYSWRVTSGSLPDGLTLAPDGTVSGTPTQPGTYTVAVTVTDADGTTVTETYTLTIHAPPTLTTDQTLPGGVAGVDYYAALATADGTAPYSWHVVGGSLPDGLTLNASTGVISGTPTTAGSETVTIAVTDAAGATTTRQYTITVGDGLTVSTTTLPAWTAGQQYTTTLTAVGGTGPYSWSVSAGALPDGLTLDPVTGTITGTPTTTGTYTFAVTVRDADGTTVTREFTLTVNAAPTIATSSTLPSGVAGVTYSQTLQTTGGTSPVSWHLADGTLPPGLTLNSDGTVSGTPAQAGTYTFTVAATDTTGATATKTLGVTIDAGLAVETATLPAWTAGQPYNVTLAAAGGTQPYTWSATGLPDGLSLNASTGTISGTPTQHGTYTVSLTVTDADGTQVTREYALAVHAAPTIATPSTLPSGVAGVTYTQTLQTTDGTDPVSWMVTNGSLPDGLSLAADGTLSGTPTTAGTHTFTVTATDAAGATVNQQVTLTVGDGLTVTTATLDGWTVNQSGYRAVVEASGGTQPYTWNATGLPAGLTIDADTGAITGTPTESGTFDVSVTATDADNTTTTVSLSLTVAAQPTMATTSLPNATERVAYSQTLQTSNGTAPTTWTVSAGSLPDGLSLAADGTLSGTPTQPGTYTFTVTATDAAGATTSQQYTVTVGAGLTVSTTALPAWTVDQSGYSQSLAASGGTAPYTWTVSNGALPDGLTLTPDGTLSGTPTQQGTYTVAVTVTDADNTTVTETYTLTVNGALASATPSTLPSGVAGVNYYAALATTGGTGPVSWTVTNGSLPDGLSLNTTTGTISGTPTQPGTATFTVTATDAAGATTSQQHTIAVGDGLTVSTATLPAWTAGQQYTTTLTAVGGTAPYSWTATGLPDGLTLNADTGTISGMPTQAGTYVVTVTATDADGTTVTRTFTLDINAAPTIATPSTLPSGVAGVSYSTTLATADGTAPTTWAMASGSLPDGLTLNSDGTISGTPAQAGTYTFTVAATDAAGATTTKTLTLTVGDGLTATTTTLPAWTVGQSYNTTLTVAGGTPAYTWSATGLPDGLSLNTSTGAITGTPTSAGAYAVTVTVTDADGSTDTQTLTLVVADAPTLTTSTLANATERVAYSQTLDAAGGTHPYAWTVTAGTLPPGLTLDADTGTITGTPTSTAAGTYTFTVTATDAAGATASQQYTLTVGAGLTLDTTSLPAWTTGQSYNTTLAASGGTPAYTWTTTGLPDGLVVDATTGAISGAPTQSGTFDVTVTVTDADGTAVTRQLTLTVNAAPTLTTPSTLPSAVQTVPYSTTLATADGTHPYSWTVSAGSLPPGLTLNTSTGTLSGTPTTAGTYTFTVTATDAAGATVSRQYTLVVGDGLTAATTTLEGWTVNQSGYSATLTAVGGTAPYSWNATGLPDGLTLNASTGAITGTPTHSGTFDVTVTVTDADGSTDTQTLTLVVAERPTVVTTTLPAATERVAYSQTLTTAQGTAPYAWTVTNGSLPDGLTLAADGTISGTPTQQGTSTVTVTATDAAGATVSQQYTLTVRDGLTLTTARLSAWTVGQAGYTDTVETAGGTAPYTWRATGLPDGLTIDADTGTITGTPTQQGTFDVTVTVVDADGTQVTHTFALTVHARPALTTPSTLPSGVAGVLYGESLTTAGGTAPYTWTATGLPDGLTLNADGSLSGVPTTAGNYTVTVTATDATGATVSQQYTLVVSDGLTATTGSLPAWTAGQQYTTTLTAAGGTPTYTWNATGLPDGLSLDATTGVISGVPTTAGSYSVTVTLRDADGTTVTETYTLTVADPPAITTTSLPNATERVAYSQPIQTTGGTEPTSWAVTSGTLPPGLSLTDDGRLTGIVAGTPTTAGTYTFTVTATDATGATASQQYTVTVRDGLTATTTTLPAWTAGHPYNATLTAAGGTQPYTWTVAAGELPAGLALNATTGRITGTPTQPGTYTVTIAVADADGTTALQSLALVVADAPRVTTPTTLPGAVQTVPYRETLTVDGGTDPISWAVTNGSLPDGLSLNASTGTISGTPTTAGTHTFTVTATDATGATASQQHTIAVGDGLTLTTPTLPAWTVGQAGYADAVAAAGGTGPYTWNVSAGTLPPGLTLDPATGVLSGAPTTAGTHTFTVTVTDADGTTTSRQYEVTVNAHPTLTTETLPSGVAGVAYNRSLTAANGTAPYTWSVVDGALPAGLSLDTDTGHITGTPTTTGAYTVTVRVTDAAGATTTQQYTLHVTGGLTVATARLPAWTAGSTGYSATLTASGGTPAYEWRASGLPDGLTIDPATGRITGTPTHSGTFDVTVAVTDADGSTATAQYSLTIMPAPTITTAHLPNATAGTAYSADLAASGGHTPYTWSATGLPDGLTIDPATGQIAGTPTQQGTSTVTVTVTDATGARATTQFTLPVAAGAQPTTTRTGGGGGGGGGGGPVTTTPPTTTTAPTTTETPPPTTTTTTTTTTTPESTDLRISDITANRSRLRTPGAVAFTVTVRNPAGAPTTSASIAAPGAVTPDGVFASLGTDGVAQAGTNATGRVRIYKNGKLAQAKPVTVPDGATRAVEFTLTFETRGRHTVRATLARTDQVGEEPEPGRQVSADVAIEVGEDCTLLGIDLGRFVVCWYWWLVALGGLLAARAVARRRHPDAYTTTDDGDVLDPVFAATSLDAETADRAGRVAITGGVAIAFLGVLAGAFSLGVASLVYAVGVLCGFAGAAVRFRNDRRRRDAVAALGPVVVALGILIAGYGIETAGVVSLVTLLGALLVVAGVATALITRAV